MQGAVKGILRRLSWRVAAVLLAAWLVPAVAYAAQPSAALTSDQAAWLANHGKVRLGLARDAWPPFDIISPSGEHTGITADYLRLLQTRTGLQFEPVLFDDWPAVMRAVQSGKVDVLGSMGRTAERERFLSFTAPYATNPAVIIARKDRQGIAGLKDLERRIVAVENGYLAQEELRRHPGIRLLAVRTTGEALQAVATGKADAYIGDLVVSTYLIDRNLMTNLEVRGPVDFAPGDLRFAVRKQLPELLGILDAGLATLTEEDQRAIRRRWVPASAAVQDGTRSIRLTDAERAWIAAHPLIRVGVDPAWEPLDFIDKDGRHAGLASEYLRLMRERLGLNLEVVPGATWAETLARAQRRELDMIALITQTPDRDKSFLFTQPYLALPMVLVTRNDARFVTDLADIEGETVAIVRDYFAGRYLADTRPDVVQMPVATIDDALEAVNRGYAFATVGSVAALGPRIQKDYLGRLKIAGSLDIMQELRMGVRSDWPQLAALLDKGLASISDEEHQALRRKWLAIRVEYGFNWREVAKIGVPVGAAVLVVLAVIVVANRRLKRQIAETERKDAELKVRLAFQQTLMDTIPSPIMFKDADARIYGCNRAYEEAFGVRREDLLGCTMLDLDLYSAELRQRLYDDDMEQLKNPGGLMHDEIRGRLADGLEHVLLYWKTSFRLPDGSIGGLLTVLVDITRLKQLEATAREARDAADAANRAKSSFLATMSHEIRTPMNAVLGMLELLALSRLDEDQMRSLDIVRDSARSLLRIIDDILDFSKIEAGRLEIKPEATSVAEVVNSVFLVCAGVASSKNLLLRKTVDDRISPALRADPLRLRQILNNFTGNALKFTQQGEVEVRVDLVERAQGREMLRFSVRDTGIGISPENQRKLFQPFVQAEADTTRRFGGTGLGLAICRRLAELMGGEVSLQSEPGKGTVMMFKAAFEVADPAELQRADVRSATGIHRALAARRRAPTPEQAQAEGTLILVADDHPVNRLLMVRQINTMGYAAEAVENGAVALEAWKSGRFALLITDCHMPEMDGYELTREIRRIEAAAGLKRTPVIACTANALQGEAEVCFAAGMDDYLPKPLEMPELMGKLDRWLPLPDAAPAPPAADAPIVADALAEVSGGDRAVEREILLEFRDASRADAAFLESSFAARDIDALKRAAHRMKGSSSMVGALDLARVCERIEKAAGSSNWEEAVSHKSGLRTEIDRINRYLEAL
jgi:two-component system sensor histidine kinase EvgS